MSVDGKHSDVRSKLFWVQQRRVSGVFKQKKIEMTRRAEYE